MKKIRGISRFGILIMSVSAVGCLVFYTYSTPNAYEVYVNGRVVACVNNISTGDKITNEVFNQLKNRFKSLKIDKETIYLGVIAKEEAISNVEDIRNNILRSINTKVKAVEMNIDGSKVAVLANKSEGEQVINNVVAHFKKEDENKNKIYTGVKSTIKYKEVEASITQVDTVGNTTEELIYNIQKGSGGALKLGFNTASSDKSISMAIPSRGSISSSYGIRWGRMHEGIDIAANSGDPIYAAVSGRVTFSGWMSGYGKMIKIDHGNKLETIYGHCSKLRVTAGDAVKKGQLIGDVGSTGNSTGPHLHFEVRIKGTPVNPYSYIYKK